MLSHQRYDNTKAIISLCPQFHANMLNHDVKCALNIGINNIHVYMICTLQRGDTALILTALNNHADIVELLLANGADASIQDGVREPAITSTL